LSKENGFAGAPAGEAGPKRNRMNKPLPAFIIPPPEDDSERKPVSDVRNVGWHALHISADDKGPSFTFTVGFYYTFQQPEILVMGLRHQVGHESLNTAADR
jgi:hypothetical protein